MILEVVSKDIILVQHLLLDVFSFIVLDFESVVFLVSLLSLVFPTLVTHRVSCDIL